MAKVTVQLRHVSWRDGRPRFNPGPLLRRLGYKGEDLKRPDGGWMTLAECEAWINDRLEEIEARRKRKAEGKRLAPMNRGRLYTVEDMFEDLWREPDHDRSLPAGQRLADSTLKFYRNKARVLMQHDAALWTEPAAAIDTAILKGLHLELMKARGVATARAVMAALSVAYSNALSYGRVPHNPLLKERRGKWRVQKPAPHIRVATSKEIAALMAAADLVKLPEIGDAVMLGLGTGQRLADLLQLEERNESGGRIRFIQNKTGARVRVPALPAVKARLAAARERKIAATAALRLNSLAPQVVVYARTARAFTYTVFNARYVEVRDAAVNGIRTEDGTGWTLEPCPSLKDFNVKDLRDTAVTWLAMAGATLPEIAAITGHTLASVQEILKHYLELNDAQADAAIGKLVTWMEQEGIEL